MVDSTDDTRHDALMLETTSRPFSTAFSAAIPPPSADRPPLRANAYEFAQTANTTLAPMFPYVQRGAIVPTTTLFTGGPDAEYGHFFHDNTEEEVALVIADNGGIKNRGMVMIAPQLHGVQCFLKDPADPESFLLIVITQRQRDAGEQKERVFFRCGCNNVLFERGYDATPDEAYDPRRNTGFTTIVQSAAIAGEFNGDEANRTCSRCGKVSPAFPLGAWGWATYAAFADVAGKARETFENAGSR
jgi:hypothetical protein